MRIFLFVLTLLGAVVPASAASLPAPGMRDPVAVGPYAEQFLDFSGRLGLEDVRAKAQFQPVGREVPNYGYTSATVWLRFTLPRQAGPLALEVQFPSIDNLELHVPYRTPEGIAYRVQRTGDQQPWHSRSVLHRHPVFLVDPTGLADAPAYLCMKTQSVLTAPVYVWRPEAFHSSDRDSQFVHGLFYGLVVALFLYNLMVWLSLRDRTYLWYVLYVAAFGIGLAALDGFGFQYLWPDSVWWANHALGTAMCATLLFGAMFARAFLDIPAIAPRFDPLVLGLAGLAGFGMLMAATGWVPYGTIMRSLSATSVVAATLVLAIASRALMRGYRPARFFLLAWSALLAFVALVALRNFTLVPTNFLTLNGLHLGLALDVLLLSMALADRVAVLKQEAEAARVEAEERERVLEQLRHMAQHDPLTGLPNRASMQERLSLALEFARRNRKKLALMLVDLDGFKQINDERGHAAGDHVLAAIGARLRSSVRGADTVARYGGDEFVVLASELERREDAAHIAEKIADMVSVPIAVDGRIENLGCSIGISLFPDDGEVPADLLAKADKAMYEAKGAKAARPRAYAFYGPG